MHITATEEQAVDTKLTTARQKKIIPNDLFWTCVLQQLDKRGDR